MAETIVEKMDKMPDIDVIDPREFKELLIKHSAEYYRELNRKYFTEVPLDFWKKLFELAGKDWFDFWSLFSNPLLYTPYGSTLLNLLYWKRLNEAMWGWKNFNEDLKVMMGWDTPSGYKVGIDVAATPNEVVMETPLLKLRHYTSGKKTVGVPIFFVYSYINGYYILDLAPGKSLVEHFVNHGFDVYITDWHKPKSEETRSATLSDYLQNIVDAVNFIRKSAHQFKIGALGYCIGGTLLDIVAALHPEKFKYLINLTTGLDTKVGDGGTGSFGAFTDLELVNLREFLKNNNGVFPGYMMNFFFDAVKPEKKAEQMYSTYVKGKGLKLDPVLFWNAESSRDVPGLAHYEFLWEVYNKNSLAKGEMRILGEKVDLKRIIHPYCNVVTRFDHIVPMPVGLQNSFLIGTPPEQQCVISVQGGHVRGVVNPKLFPLLSRFAKEQTLLIE